MSDCHGICFLIIDRGVSVGTNAWEVSVYSISGGQMVLIGCISKSGCFPDNCFPGVSLVIVMIEMAKVNIVWSVSWIYSSVY